MKKLFQKIYLWFYTRWIKRKASKYKISPVMPIDLVAAQAGKFAFDSLYVNKFAGTADNIMAGDSVAFEYFWIWNQLPNMKCVALPGTTLPEAIGAVGAMLAYKPKKVLLHIGGNDIMGNVSPNIILWNLAALVKAYRSAKVQVGWCEIVPVGAALGDVNQRCIAVCDAIRQSQICEVVGVRAFLEGPDRFIKAEYEGPDHIHPNVLGAQGWVPPVVEWFYG